MGDWCFPVRPFVFLLCTAVFTANGIPATSTSGAGSLYRGKYIGRLFKREHKVSGEVYAVDARTIHIRGFNYDGAGPDAFFWTGFTDHPSPQGIIIPDERGTKEVLGAYTNQDITLTLPDGLTLRDIKWLAVWCRAFEVNFGDVFIPENLDYPQPHVIGSLNGQHDVASGPIVVVDAQTILLPDFTYDGQAPDVHFWVGRGKPDPDGMRIPDETGSGVPLVKANKKTMVLSLPGDLTIFDIDYFGIWCRLYYVDFGHVRVPKNLNVPPSLKMLGVTPQTKLNCEVLHEDLALEVRWAVAGESIVMQLVGRIDDTDYMSFGLSGDDTRSIMIGGDVVVGWYDKNSGRGHVADYYLDSKSQCSGRRGTCPDSKLQAGSNNVRLLSAALVNGFTMLTFQRPLKAHDELDKSILTNGSQPVIWSVGPINQRQEASYHKLWNKEDLFIEFGRVPKWNCPTPEDSSSSITPTPSPTAVSGLANLENEPDIPKQQDYSANTQVQKQSAINTYTNINNKETVKPNSVASPQLQSHSSPVTSSSAKFSPWRVPPILCHEPEDRVFYAQMGPTGGKRGYSAITGQVGWGISWYINGLLVPEIYVVRGKTYTFVVEGGNDPEVPAKYHPFYITDDSEGGYQHKSPAEKKAVRVFAGHGLDGNGDYAPTATGRLCRWTEGEQPADSFASYGAYQRSLSLHCDDGHPGILHWTPDENTPDLVYYQCYTHRYLGWKIHVVNGCESGGDSAVGASEISPSRLGSPVTDQEVDESIQERTSVPHPNSNHIKSSGTGSTNPSPPTAEGGNPIDSGETRVQSALEASNGKIKLGEHKTSTLDKSQLNEKQEPPQATVPLRTATNIGGVGNPAAVGTQQQVLPIRTDPSAVNAAAAAAAAYRRPIAPASVPYPQNPYLQVSPVGNAGGIGVARPGIHPGSQYGHIPYAQDGHTLVNSGQPHSSYIPYSDPYGGQRLIDSSGLIYEARPGLDYYVGPTGRPGMGVGHPIHYDGVPPPAPIIYASTPLPIMTTPRFDPATGGGNPSQAAAAAAAAGTGASSATHTVVKSKDAPAPPAIHPSGPMIRIPQQTSAPLVGLNPSGGGGADSIKYVDYASPSSYRINTDIRGRTHTRNLPKRDHLRILNKEAATAAEDIKLGLRSIGAERIGDDSPFEIMKINDTDSLPFDIAKEIAKVMANSNNGDSKIKVNARRNPTKRQHQEQQRPEQEETEIRIPVQVLIGDEGTVPNFQTSRSTGAAGPTSAFDRQRKVSGPQGTPVRGNYMSKKFRDDKELDNVASAAKLPTEDKEMLLVRQPVVINREVSGKQKRKPAPASSPASASQVIAVEKQSEKTYEEGDDAKLDAATTTTIISTADADDAATTAGSSSGGEKQRGFKLPELTNLEPLFRPSAQDNFFKGYIASSSMMQQGGPLKSSSLAHLQALEAAGPEGRHKAPRVTGAPHHPFYRYYQTPADMMPGPQAGPVSSAAARSAVLPVKDLTSAANERLGVPYLSSSSRDHHSHPEGQIPMLPPPRPGTISAYDGRAIDLNNGGVSFRPNSDMRTPLVLHKPQYAPFRGEFPPPVPEIVPENLPQLASSRRDIQQQSRQRGPSSNQGDMVYASSNQNVRQALPPQRLASTASSSSQQPRRRLSVKPEMIPTDDVKMAVVREAEDKGREIPKFLLQRETRPDRVPLKQQSEQALKPIVLRPSSLASNVHKGKVGTSLMKTQQKPETPTGTQTQPNKDTQGGQNNTDLHILTDIWSIINQDDAARTQSGRHSERAQRNAPETFKSPIRPSHSPNLQLSGSPFVVYSQPFQRRSKRSPDHVPGHSGSDHSHDDHDHSHDHPSNSGNFLVGHLSLISIAILLSKLL